jgi:hypothetical protein
LMEQKKVGHDRCKTSPPVLGGRCGPLCY